MVERLKGAMSIAAITLIAGTSWAAAPPATSLSKCQKAVRVATQKFVAGSAAAIGSCLQAVSTEIVKKDAADALDAGPACVTAFRKLSDSRGLGKQLSDKLAASITKACAPGQDGVTHTLADVLGAGSGVAQPLAVEEINEWCSEYGGDGSVDSVDEWIDCITAVTECAVDSTVAAQFPRVLDWLNLAKGAMLSVSAPADDPNKVSDAVAASIALWTDLDPDTNGVINIQCGYTPPAAPSCTDGVLNGSEIAVDCGGGCPACPLGSPCTANGDCNSGFCDVTCQPIPGLPPGCFNGTQDGDETFTDCGGSCAAFGLRCPLGSACLANGDCVTNSCDLNMCGPGGAVPPPPCFDGVRNGNETGTDCGGSCAQKCATGVGCVGNSDCLSSECFMNICQAGSAVPPSCSDGVMNGDETAKDCGGSCVALGRQCPVGGGCQNNSDCLSNTCNLNICIAGTAPTPSCFDGVQNGVETGKDCGGGCALKCPLGSGCVSNNDCVSNSCALNICDGGSAVPPSGPSCFDSERNGDETGTDCGGSCLQACGDGSGCVDNDDCSSGSCIASFCRPTSGLPPGGAVPPGEAPPPPAP